MSTPLYADQLPRTREIWQCGKERRRIIHVTKTLTDDMFHDRDVVLDASITFIRKGEDKTRTHLLSTWLEWIDDGALRLNIPEK